MSARKKPAPAPAPAPAEPGPATESVLVAIPVALLSAIDDLAASRGPRQRTAVIRDALERGARALGCGGVDPSLEDDLAAHRRVRLRLEAALAEVELSEGEASLICDALNGTMALLDHSADGYSAAGYATHLYAEVSDGCSINGLGEKWGVDVRPFLRRLRALTPVQAMAVMEAMRLFWRASEVETPLALRLCGLVRG